MALYTILFGLSIFMIALVIAIIKKMFFHWKEEHKIESMCKPSVEHPTVSVMIFNDKCVIRKRLYNDNIFIYDVISKSDIQLHEKTEELAEKTEELPEKTEELLDKTEKTNSLSEKTE